MAKALGLTFQQIQKYERAANRMSASRLHQISRLLNVPEQWFFDEAPKESLGLQGFSDNKQLPLDNAPNAETDPMQRRETFDLVRAYYSIADAKQRRKVLELIRSMAESEK